MKICIMMLFMISRAKLCREKFLHKKRSEAKGNLQQFLLFTNELDSNQNVTQQVIVVSRLRSFLVPEAKSETTHYSCDVNADNMIKFRRGESR